MSGGICILITQQCYCCFQDKVGVFQDSVGWLCVLFLLVLQNLPPYYPSITVVVSGLGLHANTSITGLSPTGHSFISPEGKGWSLLDGVG